jgi:hypothetical protein
MFLIVSGGTANPLQLDAGWLEVMNYGRRTKDRRSDRIEALSHLQQIRSTPYNFEWPKPIHTH